MVVFELVWSGGTLVMICPNSLSQPSQQQLWMAEVVVVVFSIRSDLDQSVLDIELHLNAAVVIKSELHLESVIHQPNHNWCHHQTCATFKWICIAQGSSNCLDQSLPLDLRWL